MKRKKLLILCAALICIAAAAFFIFRPSGLESVESLRADYPYYNGTGLASMMSMEQFSKQTNGAWLTGADAFVVIKVTGGWSHETQTTYPNPAVDPAHTVDVTHLYLPVEIVWVLEKDAGSSSSLQEGSPAYLSYPAVIFEAEDAFSVGDQFVCFVSKGSTRSGALVLHASSYMTYYLTDSGQVMSLTNDKLMDSYSGKTLNQFKSAMSSVMKKSGW